MKVKTPECDKLVKVSKESQSIGAFLDWLLGEKGFVICESYETDNDYVPISPGIEGLLSEYFKIDPVKVEIERRKILDSLRKKAEK